MALTGFGVIPGGNVGAELAAVTRRAAMPAVVVQLGKATPTLSAMLSAAEPVKGGVSPVTIHVQGTRMVTSQWVDYSGSGSAPAIAAGLENAEFNLKAITTWIPYYLMEGLIQQDAELVPIIWARMNDAGNVVSDDLATRLMAPLSANTTLQPFSLFDAVGTTDPTQGAFGNLPRAGRTWWRGANSTITALGTGTTTLIRENVTTSLMFAQKAAGGEPPSCGIMSPGAFMALAADVIGSEQYEVNREGSYGEATEGPTIAFPALRVAGVPIYADVYWPDNTTVMWPNFNYAQYKIHQDAAFTVIGPESLLPQFQLGYVMVMLALLELVCSKPSAQALVTGWTGAYTV